MLHILFPLCLLPSVDCLIIARSYFTGHFGVANDTAQERGYAWFNENGNQAYINVAISLPVYLLVIE